MAMFDEIHQDKIDRSDEQKLTQEASLQSLLDSLDRDGLLDLETEFIDEVSQSGLSRKQIKRLVDMVVIKMIDMQVVPPEDKKQKIQQLLEAIKQNTPKISGSETILREEHGNYHLLRQTGDQIRSRQVTNWVVAQKQIIICSDGRQQTRIQINQQGYISFADLDHSSMESVSKFESLLKLKNNNIYISMSPQEFSETFKPFFSGIQNETIYAEDHMGLYFSETTGEPLFLYPSFNSVTREMETKVLASSEKPLDRNRICNTESAEKIKYEHLQYDSERFKRNVEIMITAYPRINHKDKAITIWAWFMAGLLGGYLKQCQNIQYAILYLLGNGEDGKSVMAGYSSSFLGHKTGTGLAMVSTPKPIKMALTNSNAHAAILEEANSKDSKVVTKVIDMLKSAYDNQDVSEGKIRGSVDFKLINPACIISNYNLNDNALMTRCIKLEIIAAEWKNNPDAHIAFEEMETAKKELNKESFLLIQFLMDHHTEWDRWFEKAKYLGLPHNRPDAVGRFSKSLLVIAFGMVMIQQLIHHVGLEESPLFTDEAIASRSEWLLDYLSNEKKGMDIEAQFLKFIASEHRKFKNIDSYKYEKEENRVLIDRRHWIDQYMEYIRKDSEMSNIPRSTVERATRPNTAKTIQDSIRVMIEGNKVTRHIIDVAQAEKEFGIESFEWEQGEVQLPLLITIDGPVASEEMTEEEKEFELQRKYAKR
jgi:hypothetical protein